MCEWLFLLVQRLLLTSRRILRNLLLPTAEPASPSTETHELLDKRRMGNGSSSGGASTSATTSSSSSSSSSSSCFGAAEPAAVVAAAPLVESAESPDEPVRIRSREGRSRSDAFYGTTRPVFNDRGEVVAPTPRVGDMPESSSSLVMPSMAIGPAATAAVAAAAAAMGQHAAPFSPSARFAIGIAHTIGRRPTMEDSLSVLGQFGGVPMRDLFMVFDGHNGSDASEYANRYMGRAIAAHLDAGKEPAAALKLAFLDIHKELIDNGIKGGTTATVVLFVGQEGWVAHVGDTRLAVVTNGELRRLTIDHRPGNADEAQKVRDRGGFIIAFGGRELRVNGMIAITRALGDRELVDALTAEPEVAPIAPFDWACSTLVLACDGLWDYLPDDDVVATVRAASDPQTAAVELRDNAYRHNSTDNISVMVIKPQLPS